MPWSQKFRATLLFGLLFFKVKNLRSFKYNLLLKMIELIYRCAYIWREFQKKMINKNNNQNIKG